MTSIIGPKTRKASRAAERATAGGARVAAIKASEVLQRLSKNASIMKAALWVKADPSNDSSHSAPGAIPTLKREVIIAPIEK